MADLSDFKWGQIISARIAGASETNIAELFGVARRTVSNDNIWERKKNLLTGIKFWKKAKAVW